MNVYWMSEKVPPRDCQDVKVYHNNNSRCAAERPLYRRPSSDCLVRIISLKLPVSSPGCSAIISIVQKGESDTERSANLPRVTQRTRVMAPGLEIRRVGSRDCASIFFF